VSHVFHRDPRYRYPVAVKSEGAYIFDRRAAEGHHHRPATAYTST
jgi:hypothetical protein